MKEEKKSVTVAIKMAAKKIVAATQNAVSALKKTAFSTISTIDNNPVLPEYFDRSITDRLNEALDSGKPVFLYLPWIFGQTDILMSYIKGIGYRLEPLELIKNIDKNWLDALRFSHAQPILYKNFIRSRLTPLTAKIRGFIFTFDWSPICRIIVDVCHELDIPTILIPHESINLYSEKYYYRDMSSHASMPVCDEIWCQGNVQKDIFISRGYPENRVNVVGSINLDQCVNYQPLLTREQFCRFYGFDFQRKIILFASQILDRQLDQKLVRNAQQQAIADILDFCESTGCAQLLIRQPPHGHNILRRAFKTRALANPCCFIDDDTVCVTSPLESICHADCVISMNSTMLLQGVIMGKQGISVCYCGGIRSAWGGSVVPVAKDTEKLKLLLNDIIINNKKFEDVIEMKRLSHGFGVGSFDGQASLRITNRLNKIAHGQRKVIKVSSAMETFARRGRIDVIGIPSSQAMLETRQKFLKQLLNANTLISSRSFENKNILAVQLFVQWGIKKNIGKELQANFARLNATPLLYLEDGLIRSIGIGLSNEPGLSIIWDSKTPYYNAKIPSCLEESLEHDNISDEDKAYARLAIDKIVANKVSKYNDAPIFRLQPETCHEGRKRILLVDQRYGDASIEYGLADARTFDKMLKDAMNTEEPCDIIIKQHPDALKGGKQSAFNKERIDEVCRSQTQNTIISIAFDINPYCLFDAVDEVWVCTSGMGFEALMAGKKVRCYGMPFYAGWGLTEDMISLPRRTRKRSIEEVFHYAYVAFSRYYDPDKGECVNVDGIVDYIMRHRDQR